MKTKTIKKNTKAAGIPAAKPPNWWEPQFDSPIGRVELVIGSCDQVRVQRAGWLESFENLLPYDIGIDLTRTADGHWQPTKTYKARRHREMAWALAEAVTAWMAVEAAEKDDLLRRATSLHNGLTPLWLGPGFALAKCADSLSADIESGVFDFDDAGHARAVATKAAERMRQMMADVMALRGELWQAITPATEHKAAA
jgi:hypothetical protein